MRGLFHFSHADTADSSCQLGLGYADCTLILRRRDCGLSVLLGAFCTIKVDIIRKLKGHGNELYLSTANSEKST